MEEVRKRKGGVDVVVVDVEGVRRRMGNAVVGRRDGGLRRVDIPFPEEGGTEDVGFMWAESVVPFCQEWIGERFLEGGEFAI